MGVSYLWQLKCCIYKICMYVLDKQQHLGKKETFIFNKVRGGGMGMGWDLFIALKWFICYEIWRRRKNMCCAECCFLWCLLCWVMYDTVHKQREICVTQQSDAKIFQKIIWIFCLCIIWSKPNYRQTKYTKKMLLTAVLEAFWAIFIYKIP